MTNEEIVKFIQSGVNPRHNMMLLYERNIGFINSIAKHYRYICRVQNRYKETSVIEYPELLQEAFIGLCNAVKGYDASMGCTFLTYAAPWVRQAISRFIENCGRTIRIPPHMQALIYQYNKIQSHFMEKYGRNATTAEVADILYLPFKDIVKLEKFMFRSSTPVSLDAPLTADDDTDLTLADSIADTTTNIEEHVVEDIVREEICGVWDEVRRVLKNQRMADIIIYRFRDGLTLEAIALEFGVTAETIRQQERKALRRLRSGSRTKRLFAMIA